MRVVVADIFFGFVSVQCVCLLSCPPVIAPHGGGDGFRGRLENWGELFIIRLYIFESCFLRDSNEDGRTHIFVLIHARFFMWLRELEKQFVALEFRVLIFLIIYVTGNLI